MSDFPSEEPPKLENAPAPPDDLRCLRTDGKKWRCNGWRIHGKSFCEKHYLQRIAQSSKGASVSSTPKSLVGKGGGGAGSVKKSRNSGGRTKGKRRWRDDESEDEVIPTKKRRDEVYVDGGDRDDAEEKKRSLGQRGKRKVNGGGFASKLETADAIETRGNMNGKKRISSGAGVLGAKKKLGDLRNVKEEQVVERDSEDGGEDDFGDEEDPILIAKGNLSVKKGSLSGKRKERGLKVKEKEELGEDDNAGGGEGVREDDGEDYKVEEGGSLGKNRILNGKKRCVLVGRKELKVKEKKELGEDDNAEDAEGDREDGGGDDSGDKGVVVCQKKGIWMVVKRNTPCLRGRVRFLR